MWIVTTEGRYVSLDGVTEITFETDLEGQLQVRAVRGDAAGVLLASIERSPDTKRYGAAIKQAIDKGLSESAGLCNLRNVLEEAQRDTPA